MPSTNETTTQTKDAAHNATQAYAEAKDQLSSAASRVTSRVASAAEQARERGQELLHTASDRVGHLYHSASDYAQEAAYEARERARMAGRYARHASDVGVSFVGTHALPLTVIGLGIGWLALSMRNESRLRALELEEDLYTTSRPRIPTLRRELREPMASYPEPRASDGTTESAKLLGVRQIEVGRPY